MVFIYIKKKKINKRKIQLFCFLPTPGGRNRRVAEAFVKTGKTIAELETELLNGQKLQGPPTAEEVNYMLKNKGLEEK